MFATSPRVIKTQARLAHNSKIFGTSLVRGKQPKPSADGEKRPFLPGMEAGDDEGDDPPGHKIIINVTGFMLDYKSAFVHLQVRGGPEGLEKSRMNVSGRLKGLAFFQSKNNF